MISYQSMILSAVVMRRAQSVCATVAINRFKVCHLKSKLLLGIGNLHLNYATPLWFVQELLIALFNKITPQCV